MEWKKWWWINVILLVISGGEWIIFMLVWHWIRRRKDRYGNIINDETEENKKNIEEDDSR